MADNLPRFMCDVMLARLARFLRAAGYDTALAEDAMPDAHILRAAAHEGRWLLTVDRKIMEHKAAGGRTLLLPHGSLEDQAAVLNAAFDLDWLTHAFTRCLVDNTPLHPATEEQIRTVPPEARRPGEPVTACPRCGRVYWRGSHFKRMQARLHHWQGLRSG
jgi:uncharacterized protein with PIN domain